VKWAKRAAALLLSTVVSALTANAYRPYRRGYPSLYAFGFGVVTSELPLQVAAGHAAAFLPLSRRLGRGTAALSWALAALSWVGLAGLYRAGRTCDTTLTAALDAGLGPQRRRESHGL
jgi:hypothetical protein